MEIFKIGCLILLVISCLVIGYGAARLSDVEYGETPSQTVNVSVSEPKPEPLGASRDNESRVQQRNVRTEDGQDVRSTSAGPGFAITWRSASDPGGATLRDVCQAMAYRLQFLQQTNKGGDQTAKLLWDVTQLLEKIEDIDTPPRREPRPSPGSGAGFPTPELEP